MKKSLLPILLLLVAGLNASEGATSSSSTSSTELSVDKMSSRPFFYTLLREKGIPDERIRLIIKKWEEKVVRKLVPQSLFTEPRKSDLDVFVETSANLPFLLKNRGCSNNQIDLVVKEWKRKITLEALQSKQELYIEDSNAHSDGITSVEALSNGNMVTSSHDQTLKIWNPYSGTCIRTLIGHTASVNMVKVLPNGNIVSGSEDGTVRVWDSETGDCIRTLSGYEEPIESLVVLSNINIATASGKTIQIWNVSTGRCMLVLSGHTSTVVQVAELSDGNLMSVSLDGTLKVWDLIQGECIRTFDLKSHFPPMKIFVVRRSGDVSSAGVGPIHIFKCSAIALMNGDIAVANGNLIKIFDINTGECKKTLEYFYGDEPRVIKELPNGDIMAGSKVIAIWNVDTGRRADIYSTYKKRDASIGVVNSIACLPNGNILVSLTNGRSLFNAEPPLTKKIIMFDVACSLRCLAEYN